MKIGIDYAYYNKDNHNINSTKMLLNPKIVLNEIGELLIKKLKDFNVEVVDCSPPENKPQTDMINSTIELGNNSNLDLFLSITLNAFSAPTKYGTEILINSKSDISYELSKKIQNRLQTLGYSNRGIIKNSTLPLINKMNCPSLLIKCFFITNHWECKRYNKELIVDAIFNSLISKDIFYNTTSLSNY